MLTSTFDRLGFAPDMFRFLTLGHIGKHVILNKLKKIQKKIVFASHYPYRPFFKVEAHSILVIVNIAANILVCVYFLSNCNKLLMLYSTGLHSTILFLIWLLRIAQQPSSYHQGTYFPSSWHS